MHIYICIYIKWNVKNVFLFLLLLVQREKKSKYFKMKRSFKRFVFFKEILFHSYRRLCFRLVFVREQMWHKAIGMRHPMALELTNLHEWVRVSLGAPFIWSCVTYVLWRKQPAGNIHMCENEINNSLDNINFSVYWFILKHTYKRSFCKKMNTVTQVQILDKTVCISQSANTLLNVLIRDWLA